MFSSLLGRASRRSLLIEINPYQILTAQISRPDQGPVVLERVAEFDRADDAGLRQWLEGNLERQRNWAPAICGFAQAGILLLRDSIEARKLAEPGYLANLVKEQSKVEQPEAWQLYALNPLDGTAVQPEGIQRPGLICGVSHTGVHQLQQRLLDLRLLPTRLEIGILPLLGVISDDKARRNDKRATVVVVIEQEHTAAYILGKEGIHTPGPVRHGFAAIVQAARKEFGIDDDQAAQDRLRKPDGELLLRATRLVRSIGRDLKPLVDSYEMTTGQPVGEIYCAYLPPALAWIAEPLAHLVGRTPIAMDCSAWMPSVNLTAAPGLPAFGPHWLGPLSLVAELAGAKPGTPPPAVGRYHGPWHVDCRISTHLPSNQQVRRKFLNFAVAATVVAAVLTFTYWQIYTTRILGADTEFWNRQLADNQKLFHELNENTRIVAAGAARLDQARELMVSPLPVTDFVLNLGRTLPAHMRIDRIETNAGGLALYGGLNEPSEQASRTLDRYVDDLHHTPAIGPLFASISLTSLQRDTDADGLSFVITFRLKSALP